MGERSWRRCARRAAAYLLCGAAVSVAVAWGCALWSPWPRGMVPYSASGIPQRVWPVAVAGDWPPPETVDGYGVVGVRYLAAYAMVVEKPVTGPKSVHTWRMVESLAGAPFYCLYGYSVTTPELVNQSGTFEDSWQSRGLLRLPERWFGLAFDARRPLPIYPRWGGLLANTAVYGGAVWAAWMVILLGISTLRRARGRCARCGYSRAGLVESAACPECGAAPRAARTA